ncbi:MAG: LysR substrate-binding domain-containing protein, partial [Polaromonas sp.]|nr:LysR substrate-binding domain-containing protein [Polaromonas sp.]
IPRLPDFQQQHPQIALHFVPYPQGYDFQRADLDCSILFGDGHWPGAIADYITGREVVLIAPPRHAGLREPADIAGFTLLQHLSVPHAWTRWCQAHSVEGVDGMTGPQIDQFHSLIRAVMAGMGLALVPRCLVKDDIAAGLVSAPIDDDYQDEMGYYLCYPESRRHLQPLNQFRDWLLRSV